MQRTDGTEANAEGGNAAMLGTRASGPATPGGGLNDAEMLPFPADRRRVRELTALCAGVSQGRSSTRRTIARSVPRFELPGVLVRTDVMQPGGDRVRRELCTFNVSSMGAALIVPGYLNEGTRVWVRFTSPRCELPIDAAGVVRWCDFLSAPFHLAGVKWDDEIDVKPLVSSASWEKAADALAASVRIEGEALVFSEHDMDRSLVSMLLSQTDIRTTPVSSTGEVLDLVQQCQFDVALLDMDMDAMSPIEFLEHLRDAEFDGPLVAMSRDEAASTLTAIDGEHMTRFLAKPIDESGLHRSIRAVLREHGLRTCGSGPIESTLADRPQFTVYINEFVQHAVEASSWMLELTEADRTDEVLGVLEQFASNSAGFGFRDLGERADRLIGVIRSVGSVKARRAAVRKFCELLVRLQTPSGGPGERMVR